MLCGYAFLSDLFALKPLSLAEKARTDTKVNKLVATESGLLVPPKMAPANTVLSHLIFSIKHEGINLEVLSQVLPIRCHTTFRHPFNLSRSGKTCDIRRSSKTTS